jgi:hypothetical protein
MHALAQLHLEHLPHPAPTFTVVGSFVAIFAIWSFLILEAVRMKAMKADAASPAAKRNAVISAVLVSFALSGVGYAGYRQLETFQQNHMVAVGHHVCRSWSFGSMLPEEPATSTVMASYGGIAEFTCADASEHFVDLATGKRVSEPIGFFAPVGSGATTQ